MKKIISLLFFLQILITPQLQIKAVGDVMLGSVTPKKIIPNDGGKIFVKSMKNYLSGSDIVFGNFEGTIIKGSEKPVKCKPNESDCYEFGTYSYLIPRLKELGFNVMGVNNNHCNDYGYTVYKQTLKTLNDLQIQTAAKKGYASLKVKGKKVAIIAFSYSYTNNENNIDNVSDAVKKVTELKKQFDYVVVSFHGGMEGNSSIYMKDEIAALRNSSQGLISFAHKIINAGADVILGSGPHVFRPIEIYKGKLIAYSLGNFLTYGNFSLSGYCGVTGILDFQIDKSGNFLKGKLIPVFQKGYGVPYFDSKKRIIKLMQQLCSTYPENSKLRIDDEGNLFILKK